MVRSALLLAAGLGTRLRPLTDVLPKCLAPVRGRPLLEYWLSMLDAAGVERILINTHYRAEIVRAYATNCSWARKIQLVHEEELLGTGGTLVANAGFARNEPLLVAHADNLSLFDVRAFAAAHGARPAPAQLTMMTFITGDPSSCGVVTTDNAGLVEGFFEKVANPPSQTANAAVYMMEPTVLELAVSLRAQDISTEVLPRLVGRMSTWHNGTYHRDIGTLESWRTAQREFPGDPFVPTAPDAWAQALTRHAPTAMATADHLLRSPC